MCGNYEEEARWPCLVAVCTVSAESLKTTDTSTIDSPHKRRYYLFLVVTSRSYSSVAVVQLLTKFRGVLVQVVFLVRFRCFPITREESLRSGNGCRTSLRRRVRSSGRIEAAEHLLTWVASWAVSQNNVVGS